MTLEDFLKKYGTSTTTNFQLVNYAKQLKIPNFHVCMRDEIKDLPNTLPINIIANIHTSNQKGVHWSAMHIDNNNNAYYFDSYGLTPTKEILNFTKGCKVRERNTSEYQDFNDSYCGQLALFVLYKLNSSNNFRDVVSDFH